MERQTSNPAQRNLLDGEGNSIQNEILLRLPAAEREMVFPKLEFVRLKAGQVLHEAGDPLKSGYFCDTGVVSVVAVFPNGKTVEVGLVGKEGFVGSPLVAGFTSSHTRAVVQVEATALRIDADALSHFLRTCPQLERKLQQSSQMMAMEATQIAACNLLHEVEQRLARWLLMCRDRIGSTLPLTQELLAQMLGARRASVTIAASILKKAGLIDYRRKSIRILDHAKLEESGCECYGMIQRRRHDWRRESG